MLYPQPRETAQFDAVLERLLEATGAVGALVTAPDGLPVTTRMADHETGESWAAMAAVTGRLASQLLKAAAGDEMTAAVFNAVNYQFVVLPVEVGFLLTVAPPGAEGAVLYEQTKAAAEEVNAAAAALTERGEDELASGE
jgi:predicted regulator of Ras-like GTPase activity (Roadblock/LC7/MglB family)